MPGATSAPATARTQHGLLGFVGSRTGIAFLGFAAVAAFFLTTEHRAHVWGVLPYLLILLCPLLHLFHKGHGGHAHHGAERSEHVHARE